MTYPRYTALAQTLPASVPFVGPEAQERARGARFDARLGANENGFGPAPAVLEAIKAHAHEAWMYGEPESYELRSAIADHHGAARENIVVGEGIDGLLGYVVRLVVGAGDAVVTSDGAYPTFNYHVAGFGGVLHKVPYKGDFEDPDALLAKAREVDAKLVYLSNPDNPMGTYISAKAIEAMIEGLPAGCLLILDEAYVEFAPQDAIPDIAIDHPAVIRMRTFSKGYGLAGMRVGYAMGAPELILAFEKIRNHFGMNRIAQIAALAALKDQAGLDAIKASVAEAKRRIAQIAAQNGLMHLPSATNFVAIDCGGDDAFARRVLGELIARGIFVRMPFVAPQSRCIRVSCGPEVELQRFEQALPEALKAARSV
ncbi:MAG: pyridoxal phosphate-dependent aminotransferase [Planktotalea sp.]|uniref:pyridoxal phosphate-dependent aminotransferase n=1 Tax=Planktotalea sp. TaxID=2029877 RepID=UPI003C760E9C